MRHLKSILFAALAVGCLALTSCRDQVQQLTGSYSYKISGSAIVDGDQVSLDDETGALQVLRLSADSAVWTCNAMLGHAYVTRAAVNGKQVTLVPYVRDLSVGATTYHITASGSGTLYDEAIILTLRYSGDGISANQLTMLCKKN